MPLTSAGEIKMKQRGKSNVVLHEDHALIRIPHKDRIVDVAIDIDDIEVGRAYKWSIMEHSTGYLATAYSLWTPGVGQKTIYLSRVLMNPPDGFEVDHEDRNPLNMRRYNLRIVTHAQNQQNRQVRRQNQTKERGVTLRGRKFRARVQLNKTMHNLG